VLRLPRSRKTRWFDALRAEALRVNDAVRANIRRVQVAVDAMQANTNALSVAVARSRRLLREIKEQQVKSRLAPAPIPSPSRSDAAT
jgi:hypothetical protein